MPSLTKIQTGFLEPQGAFELDPGTASAPGLKFSTSAATGMFSPSSGVLGFSTGSTQQALTILADGKVGVGVTNPSQKLSVSGVIQSTTGEFLGNSTSEIKLGSTWGTATLYIKAGDTVGAQYSTVTGFTTNVGGYSTAVDADSYIGTNNNYDFYIKTHNTEKVRVTSTGNVGIGTTNPGYTLDVQGSQNVTTQISLWGRTIGQPQTLVEPGRIYATSAGLGPGNLLLQPTGGNVGIGTTNPASILHVVGTLRSTGQAYLGIGETTTITYIGDPFTTNTKSILFNRSSTITDFVNIQGLNAGVGYTSFTMQALGGNVGIGTTDPTNPLHVYGSNSNIVIANASTGSAGLLIRYLNATEHGTNLLYNPGSAITYLDNTYPVVAGTVYGDMYFRQNVASTMTNRLVIKGYSGNVGIGTSIPLSKIDSRGNILIATNTDGDNILSFGNSQAYGPLTGAPNSSHGSSFIVGNSSTTSGAPSHISVWTSANGVVGERLRVTSTGNVGIGTANPGTKLDVYGDIAVNGTFAIRRNNYGYSATYKNVFIGSTDSLSNTVSLCVDTSTISGGNFHGQNQVIIPRQGLLVPNQAGTNFIGVLSKDSNDYIRIGPDSSGGISNGPITVTTSNVGIGTDQPLTKFFVKDGSSSMGFAEYNGGATIWLDGADGDVSGGDYFNISANNSQQLAFGYAGGANVVMSSTGNVGIGTDNPITKLHLSSGGVTQLTISNTSTSMSDGATIGTIDFSAGSSNTVNARVAGAVEGTSEAGGDLVFETRADGGSLLERLRITSTGNVGIGTANPGVKLHVEGAYPQIIVNNPTAGSGSNISFRNAGTIAGTIGHLSTTAGIQFASDSGATAANILTFSDGYLGIGENNPSTAIFVMANTAAKGSVAISANQNVPVQFVLQQGYNGRQGLVFASNGDPSNTSFALINNQGGKRLTLQTASYDIGVSSDLSTGWSEKLCVTSGGNVGIGTTNPTEKLHVHNGSIRTDGLYGRRFTDFTSTSGTTGYIDTGFAPDTPAAVYQLYISVNPLNAGSSAYRDVVYGKVFYGTGWNGSTVTSYIYFVQENPSRMYISGSEIFVDVVFLRNSVMYNTLPFSDLYTNTQFRIVVDSPSQVGTYISATFHRVHY